MEEYSMDNKADGNIELNILSLEDSIKDFELIRENLTDAGFQMKINRADSEKEFVPLITSNKYDIILADFNLPSFDAFKALKLHNEICPETPFICVSGTIGEETAIELIRQGAVDYVLKDNLARLPIAVKRAFGEAKEKEIRKLAEKSLANQNEILSKLNKFSTELAYLPSEENIEAFIVRKLKEIPGVEVATFSQYNYENQTSTVSQIEMEPMLLEKVVNLIGTQIKKIHTPVSKEMYQEMISVRVGIKSNLHEISFGAIPRPVGATIETLLKVDRFIGLAYIIDDKLYGTSMIAMKKGIPDPPQEFLESLTYLSSVSLRRIQAEQELRESERKFRKIYEEGPLGMVFVNSELKFMSANPAFCQMMGYSEQELKNITFREITDPDNIVRDVEKVKKLIKGEISIYRIDKKYIRKDKKVIWGSLTTTANRNDKGEFLHMVGMVEDITERKNAEEALFKSRDLLIKLTDQVPGVVYQYRLYPDGSSCFPFASIGMQNIYEVSPQEVQFDATPVFGRIHPDDYDLVATAIADSAKTQKLFHCEFRVILPKQGLRWRLSDAKPELLEDGSTLWYGIISDITDRKLAEIELKEKEVQFSNLANSGKALIWTSGPDKLANYFNEPWLQFTGRKLEQELGNGWTNGVHPDDLEDRLQTYTSAFDKRENFDMEYRLRHSSGEYRWIFDMGIPNLNSAGEFIGYIGHVFDITLQKEEKNLLESQHAMLNAIINSSKDFIIFSLDKNYCYTSFNRKHAEEVKMIWNIEIQIGLCLFDCMVGDDIKTMAKQSIDRVFKGEAFTEIQIQPGFEIYYELNWNPIWLNQEIVGVTVFIKDITERKKSELILKESERKLREAQEMANLGFWSWNINTGEVEWSDEVFKIFGLDPNEFTPQIDSILELSPWPEDNQRDRELINRAVEDHSQGSYEQKFLRPDKSIGYYYSTFEGRYDENNKLISIVGTVLDITERKSNEIKLKNALTEAQRFREALDYVSAFIYIKDTNFCYQYANKATLELFHCPSEELAGSKDSRFFPPDIIKRLHEVDTRAFNGEQTNEEIVVNELDGTQRIYLDIKTPIYENENGRIIGLLGISTDITQIKLAEEKVKKIGKHYQALIENAPDGIVLINKEVRFAFISPSAKRMFGYENSDIPGSPNEYTHPDDLPEVLSILNEIIQNPQYIPTIQYRFRNKNGKWKWIESTFTNLLSDPNVDAIVINFRDIDNRKIAEAKLQESEEKYRMIADNTDDWIYWVKPDGNFQYISPSCERVTGYSAEEFTNNPKLIDEIIYAEDKKLQESHHKKVSEKKVPDNLEFRIVTKNGEIQWINHSCSPIYNSEGEYVGRRGTNRNITERRRAEEKEHMALSRLRRFVDSSIVGIVIAQSDGKIVETNDYYLNMLGYTRQEFEAGMLDWRSITPKEWLPVDEKAIQELNESGISEPYEKEYFHRNGERIVVLIADALLPGPEEQIAAFVLDITSRKQTEQDLIENNSRLELAMQAANMAWWEMEMASGNVIFNKRKAEMLGYPSEKFKHYTDFMKLVHPEDYENTMNAMCLHLTGIAEKYETEYRIMTNVGEYKWFYDLGSVVKKYPDGKPLLITGLVLDISKRKMAEERILNQLSELQRWQKVSLGREDRSRELKREVNELLVLLGKEIKYTSQEDK